MQRARQVVGKWRPRTGTLMVMLAAVLAAGGVGWAATRSSSDAVINACVNADNALFFSNNGSCPTGETPLSWNQQGPQGPAGQTAQPVLTRAPSFYKKSFSIRAEIDAAGNYFVDGSVDLQLTPTWAHYHHAFTAFCYLYDGPPNGSATRFAQWQLHFKRVLGNKFFPASVTGGVDVNGVLNVTRNQVPLELYLSCQGGRDAVWTAPDLYYELTAGPSVFHPTVGPALPNKPVIGPGPLVKIFGTH